MAFVNKGNQTRLVYEIEYSGKDPFLETVHFGIGQRRLSPRVANLSQDGKDLRIELDIPKNDSSQVHTVTTETGGQESHVVLKKVYWM